MKILTPVNVRLLRALAQLAVVGMLAGCTTLRHTAVDKLGDALAAGGSSFSGDDDPQLIASAAPFSLKMMESLLAERPQHRGLLLAAAAGFTQYAYAFVQQESEEREERDFATALEMKARARRLYLRARDYGLRGLEVNHPGFGADLRVRPTSAVTTAGVDDVPLLYWTAVSWSAAIALAKDDPDLIADLPSTEALIQRALQLDESFDRGAIHGFLISYEASRTTAPGSPAERARAHFERAVALSQGRLAAPFVALAEAVSVQNQDRREFNELLHRAVAIDPNAAPESRLVNLVLQRRARWLLARADQLFLAKANSSQ